MQRSASRLEHLHWDDVKLFLTLCRHRTLGDAARALRVDASTVSRRLAVLEEVLAAALFDRGRDGVAPTAAAENLLPVAEEIEHSMARFANQAERLERTATGVVRIASPPDVAEVVVVPLLAELRARHPGLSFVLDPGETLRDLTRREADLALRTVRPTSGDLWLTKLTSAPWVLVAAPRLARSLGTLRSFDEAPWVTWGERLAGIGAARWFATYAKATTPAVRSDNLTVQLAAVKAGLGIALVPEPTQRHYRLAPVKLGRHLRDAARHFPRDELYLVTHRALRDVPRVRAVWDLLLERWGER